MPERLELAKDRKPQRQLMAAMAQLDCGQCGYLCQTYAEAVWSGGRGRHGPLRAGRQGDPAQAEGAFGRAGTAARRRTRRRLRRSRAAPVGSRDRPALATLVDAYPLNRPGSGKDVRHVVFDLSATDLTYEAGDSLGVFARKNPQLVQAVLDRVGATGEEMVAFDGEALPLRQVLLEQGRHRPAQRRVPEFLATRAFDGEEALKLQALARGEGPAELAEADLLDLLMAFPSVMPSLPGLLKSLDRLQPRLYSIASSSKAHPREVHLTVSAVRWDSNERTRTGIGSLLPRRLRQAGRRHPDLRAEEPRLRPAGRRQRGRDHGRPGHRHRAVPRFPRRARGARRPRGATGCSSATRSASADFLYEDQIMDWQRRGVLHRLDLAFSRDQAEKIYVQHRMQESGGRALAMAGGGRALLCLRRCQAHGQGRRGHAAADRGRAGRQEPKRKRRPGSTASPRPAGTSAMFTSLPDRRLPAGIMIMSRLEAGGPEES